MKTALSAPAPDEGAPTGAGSGAASAAAAAAMPSRAPAASAASGPHYGQARYDSGARYAVGDDVPPVSDGARVKMDLARRNNDNMQSYVGNHITQMTGNVYFPTPQPVAGDLLALFQDFQTKLAAWVSADTAAKDATSARDAARAALTEAMNVRAAYVQQASNGNRNAILTSGLGVRNDPTPVGVLPPPVNLSIELNGTAGVMFLKWSPVASSRGYNIQCSPANTMERTWTPLETTTTARYKCEGMTLGQTYAFRIAAIGGSTGQSDWSAEVVRMAA